ncbi:transposase [Streptomyces bohaiensis]|uniref:Transposase n=1 Tax=Streptomyces bohaiensis TaxID=1431344 RepID=A0ABX1C2J9_9ACTN|nr:transposase [Streptomyces bohaiensis]
MVRVTFAPASTGQAARRRGIRLRPASRVAPLPHHHTARRATGYRILAGLGGRRWTVERTVAWLSGCRRLHRRYERKAEHLHSLASPPP